MEKTFSKSEALRATFTFAWEQVLRILPYYLVVCFIVMALSVLNIMTGGGAGRDFLIGLVELILISAVAVLFYLRALKHSQPAEYLLRDTRNVFFATLLVALLFLIVGFLIALFLSVFAGILLANDGFDPAALGDDTAEIAEQIAVFLQQPEGVIIAVLVLISLVALSWLAARLILYGVATAVAGRVRVFETWGWTRQHGVQILLAGFVVSFLPLFIARLANFAIGSDGAILRLPLWFMTLVTEGVGFVFYYPVFLLGHGFAVAVYRQLSPELVDVEDAFG